MLTAIETKSIFTRLPWLGAPAPCCDILGRHSPKDCPKKERFPPRWKDEEGRIYRVQPYDPMLPTEIMTTQWGQMRALEWLFKERDRIRAKGYPAVFGKFGMWVTLVYYEEETLGQVSKETNRS